MSKDPTIPVRDDADLPIVPYANTLQGQPALITGASSGIGMATALGMAQAGADIVVNYIGDSAPAEEVAHRIEGFGCRAIAIEADVSKEEQVQAMFAKAIGHFGTLHVVVSNAGCNGMRPLTK